MSFIRDFSHIAAPPTSMLKSRVDISHRVERVFTTLVSFRSQLQAPSKHPARRVGSSHYLVGALTQVDEAEWHPILRESDHAQGNYETHDDQVHVILCSNPQLLEARFEYAQHETLDHWPPRLSEVITIITIIHRIARWARVLWIPY